MNKTYCECSAGWYQKLFSEVFEKEVSVKIVDTIVNLHQNVHLKLQTLKKFARTDGVEHQCI